MFTFFISHRYDATALCPNKIVIITLVVSKNVQWDIIKKAWFKTNYIKHNIFVPCHADNFRFEVFETSEIFAAFPDTMEVKSMFIYIIRISEITEVFHLG